ncbi:hypothetical protein [Gloeothece verrucosa]|uniref:Uncharacterized protein n=1 Tax=Gloeothece verrucosa (strain PCC 7822) TaxID=497965 RepID=E0UJ76_GLOV7|nr:hypothetical protein [Gloeothece verrucosa]ADN15779.1 hypothetical protein Cyan7822_3847 [Gloeothece verrucosa PCC 7822]
MTKPRFDLPENWESVGVQTGIRRQNADGSNIPLSPLIFPLTIHTNTVLIQAAHFPVQPDGWKYAGAASMTIRSGVGAGGNLDTSIGVKKLWFKRINLCVFPNWASDYGLTFYVPEWFTQIQYSVWAYIGPGDPDLETKTDKVYQEALGIHSDLTTLINDFDAYTGMN